MILTLRSGPASRSSVILFHGEISGIYMNFKLHFKLHFPSSGAWAGKTHLIKVEQDPGDPFIALLELNHYKYFIAHHMETFLKSSKPMRR